MELSSTVSTTLSASDADAKVKNPSAVLKKFALMLSHPEFEEFINTYFQTWEDCKESIMLLKTGQSLKEMVVKQSGRDLTGNELAKMMQDMVGHESTRSFMVQKMIEFMNGTASMQLQIK